MTRPRDIADGINRIDTSAADATAITIDANENVGIGGTPSHLLDIQRATNGTQARFIVNDGSINPRLMIYGSASGSHIQHTSTVGSKSLIFEIDGSEGSGTEAARIDGTRTLGVGTTRLLDANGYVSANGAVYGKGFATANDRNDNAGFLTGLGITNGNNGSTNNGVATGRLVAYVGGRTVTSDSNADDDSGASLEFYTKGENAVLSRKMVLDSSGNLLVGTTTAGISNSISTTIEASGLNNSRIYVNHSSTGSSNNSLYMGFGYGGNTIGSIRQNSTSSVSYLTTSDYRLKENAVAISDGITRVKSLQPKRFNFIADQSTTVDGFLAHEVSDVVPEAIGGEKDAMMDEEYEVTPAVLDDDGNVVTEAVMGTRSVPDYQGIDQSKLVPLLTAALQEAITKIETLEAKVTALENT